MYNFCAWLALATCLCASSQSLPSIFDCLRPLFRCMLHSSSCCMQSCAVGCVWPCEPWWPDLRNYLNCSPVRIHSFECTHAHAECTHAECTRASHQVPIGSGNVLRPRPHSCPRFHCPNAVRPTSHIVRSCVAAWAVCIWKLHPWMLLTW